MSITKRLSVKVAKPQDQTSASKLQALTEAILADQTTALSKSIDDAVMNSLVYGSSMLRVDAVPKQPGGYVWITDANNPSLTRVNPMTPRFTRELLETHPVFQLNREQLRAAWLVQFGHRWVNLNECESDTYLMSERLQNFGEMEAYSLAFERLVRIAE